MFAKGENGSLVGVPGDRKRGTGGRSRTLAPPCGAAWIIDCSLALGSCGGVGDELDAWDARCVSLSFSFGVANGELRVRRVLVM